MRPVIRSYKKVLNIAPQSHSGATIIKQKLVEGKDALAAGQTGV